MPEQPTRSWPLLSPILFAGSLVVYAVGLPLGLDRFSAASKVAAAVTLDTTGQRQGTPLALFTARILEWLPLGDLASRANLAAALLAALAATLTGRLCADFLLLLRPPPHARQGERHFLHEPFAAGGAALAAALALASFHTATASISAAATLVVLAACWRAAVPFMRCGGSNAQGLALAALAGLGAGVDPVAGPLLWPLVFGLWVWELHRGARWPLLAPVFFAASFGGTALATVAASHDAISVGGLLGSLWPNGVHDPSVAWATLVELADELGVVGVALAGTGVVVLLTRAPLVAIWFAFTFVTAILLGHPLSANGLALEPARAALPAALMVTAIPVSAGTMHLAGRLGRARLPAAIVLAVLVVVSPALDGGGTRWLRDTRASGRLLEYGLARAPLRSVVDPGSLEMEGLFHYGTAVGLRPDLEMARPR